MLMPSGFDAANRNYKKDKFNKRKQKANQLNDRIRNFINEVNKDYIDDDQKKKVIETIFKGLTI